VRVLRRRRRLRLALLAVLVCAPLLAGGWLWLRHSSLVSVQRVLVSGVHGPDARAIDAALTGAARRMSTLDVHPGALRAAAAPFRVVRDVQATPSFPHGLRIRVIEQLPVAALVVGGVRTAAAADGVVLGPALLTSSLPTVGGASGSVTSERVRGASVLGALTVLGAAPAPLARVLARAFTGPKGLTVVMRNGLLVYFGDASRPHAKWLSLARVLADPSSAGASYVDERLPERPAAGFAPGTAPPLTSAAGTTAAGTTASSSEQATAESLVAGLTAAVASGGSTGHEAPSSPSPSTETTSSTPAETTSPAPTGTAAAAGPEAPAAASPPGG
jgi:cell division protein FtsQ